MTTTDGSICSFAGLSTSAKGKTNGAATATPTSAGTVFPGCMNLCRAGCSITMGMGRSQMSARRQASQKRSEEHTSELQSRLHLVCRLLLEKKKKCIQT